MKKILLSVFSAFVMLIMPKAVFAQTIQLGTAANFALFTSVGAFTNLGPTMVTGDIGTNAGPMAGFPPGTVNGLIVVENAVTLQASVDVTAAYDYFGGLICGQTLVANLGGGQILTPNIYCIGSAIGLSGDLILNGQNNPGALFIIQIDGALSTSAISKVLLINGACSENVFWQVNGATELGTTSEFVGTIVSNGAISLLVGATLNGRGLTKAGAINLNTNPVSVLAQCQALAIKLTKFSVRNDGEINSLDWTSASANNGDFFELERSADARHFEKIASVPSKTENNDYHFNDVNASFGMNYYRLKMMELSGKFSYSQIVATSMKTETTFDAYPNPVKNVLNLEIIAKNANSSTINILDVTGKSMNKFLVNEAKTEIDMSHLPQGTYFIKYSDKNRSQIKKIIKL
ncbi:MAG: ice-binding family protein [Bacteroidota bacterium]